MDIQKEKRVVSKFRIKKFIVILTTSFKLGENYTIFVYTEKRPGIRLNWTRSKQFDKCRIFVSFKNLYVLMLLILLNVFKFFSFIHTPTIKFVKLWFFFLIFSPFHMVSACYFTNYYFAILIFLHFSFYLYVHVNVNSHIFSLLINFTFECLWVTQIDISKLQRSS